MPLFACQEHWYDFTPECLRDVYGQWYIAALASLTLFMRGGWIHHVERILGSALPFTLTPGRYAKRKTKITLDVDVEDPHGYKEQVEYTKVDMLELNKETASTLHKQSWKKVQALLGWSDMQMIATAALRLIVLHLAQPVSYMIAFYAFQSELDVWQRGFAIGILVKEFILLKLIICMAWNCPAFLFLDAEANWSLGNYGVACTFVASPDLLIAKALTTKVVLLVLNHCSLGAAYAGLVSGTCYPILSVYYAMAFASLLAAAIEPNFEYLDAPLISDELCNIMFAIPALCALRALAAACTRVDAAGVGTLQLDDCGEAGCQSVRQAFRPPPALQRRWRARLLEVY